MLATSSMYWVSCPAVLSLNSAVALAGTGLLTTVGVIVAMDTFGPVSDNAQGIAEMSGDVDEEGAKILTELDAVGNTTKAITKGIAIATAVLAATALFGSYRDAIGTAVGNVDVSKAVAFNFQVFSPNTLVGVIIGAAVVFMFSGLAINAVTRAAGAYAPAGASVDDREARYILQPRPGSASDLLATPTSLFSLPLTSRR